MVYGNHNLLLGAFLTPQTIFDLSVGSTLEGTCLIQPGCECKPQRIIISSLQNKVKIMHKLCILTSQSDQGVADGIGITALHEFVVRGHVNVTDSI